MFSSIRYSLGIPQVGFPTKLESKLWAWSLRKYSRNANKMSRNTALSMPSLSATKVYIDPISDFTFLSTAKSGKPWIKRNKPCCALHIEASFELQSKHLVLSSFVQTRMKQSIEETRVDWIAWSIKQHNLFVFDNYDRHFVSSSQGKVLGSCVSVKNVKQYYFKV